MIRGRDARIALFLVAAAIGAAKLKAQTSADTTRQPRGDVRAWFSAGLGAGSSFRGDFVGRAAASLAVNRLVVFTLDGTAVGDIDRAVSSIDLMVGARTPRPDAFLFASAGPANVSCGSGCGNQTGIAIEGGYHIGARYAGVSLVGFVIRAPAGSNSAGVVVALDLGLFDRR